jgi:hypothetical protein
MLKRLDGEGSGYAPAKRSDAWVKLKVGGVALEAGRVQGFQWEDSARVQVAPWASGEIGRGVWEGKGRGSGRCVWIVIGWLGVRAGAKGFAGGRGAVRGVHGGIGALCPPFPACASCIPLAACSLLPPPLTPNHLPLHSSTQSICRSARHHYSVTTEGLFGGPRRFIRRSAHRRVARPGAEGGRGSGDALCGQGQAAVEESEASACKDPQPCCWWRLTCLADPRLPAWQGGWGGLNPSSHTLVFRGVPSPTRNRQVS